MKIDKAEFLISSPDLKRCPDLHLPEIALLGRSNVGKSSFINAFCNRKKLAKTSNTPGKTRLINFFNIEDKFTLVDLPGYGYAKVSKSMQQDWQRHLEDYILNRPQLLFVIQFIDARHEVQKNDFQMREWLNYNNIAVLTIATKIDTLKTAQKKKSVQAITKKLASKVYGFSAKDKEGKDLIMSEITRMLSL